MTTINVRSSRAAAALIAAAACLLLSACGSSSHPTAASGSRTAAANQGAPAANAGAKAAGSADACSLLTQTEVDAAVGQPLGAAHAGLLPGTCQWSTADFTAGVDITVGDWTSIKGAATSGGTTPVAISGVGDEALNLNGSNGSLLYVRKAGNGFLLSINGPHIDSLSDHGLAQEKVLAAAAIGRM